MPHGNGKLDVGTKNDNEHKQLHQKRTAKQAPVLENARLEKLVNVKEEPIVDRRVAIRRPITASALVLSPDLSKMLAVQSLVSRNYSSSTHPASLPIAHPLSDRYAHLMCNEAEVASHVTRKEICRTVRVN